MLFVMSYCHKIFIFAALEQTECSFVYLLVTYILCRTVFQLFRSIGEIIAFDKGVSLVIALVVGNFCEYRHKS